MQDLIKEQLKKTVGEQHYNGWNNRGVYGYHSYDIGNIHIQGQRNPKLRLDEMRKHVDFKGKNVLDLGCNVGAMLHHLDEIVRGFGIDYDHNCIIAGNEISKILGRDNLGLLTHDFDMDCNRELKEIITDFKPDIIFLLSIGSWVESWKKLYKMCLATGAIIILETNNDEEGKPQLEFFENQGKEYKLIINNSKDDCTGNHVRKTYLING